MVNQKVKQKRIYQVNLLQHQQKIQVKMSYSWLRVILLVEVLNQDVIEHSKLFFHYVVKYLILKK